MAGVLAHGCGMIWYLSWVIAIYLVDLLFFSSAQLTFTPFSWDYLYSFLRTIPFFIVFLNPVYPGKPRQPGYTKQNGCWYWFASREAQREARLCRSSDRRASGSHKWGCAWPCQLLRKRWTAHIWWWRGPRPWAALDILKVDEVKYLGNTESDFRLTCLKSGSDGIIMDRFSDSSIPVRWLPAVHL